MGLGFTIDTPVKVAHFGIDSVVSIVDDDLIEKMRKVHTTLTGRQFEPISIKENDYRAKRITAYLNLLDEIVQNKFNAMKDSFGMADGDFEKYIAMLPDGNELKRLYNSTEDLSEIKETLLSNVRSGSIDVNIMTKIDKTNYEKDEKLPAEFNDAHSALRGFANSNLRSSVVFSAGMNPRLYSYIEKFDDFYPDENNELKKKIIIKVSDFRSALIQGKFLAKKGLWVSEYRIESGLNCGGHAFATDGFLLGPILEEFKKNRAELIQITNELYTAALKKKNIEFSGIPLALKVTAQGGVGTFEEQKLLLEHFNIDSVGWGTPFLLVPEATNLDEDTVTLLSKAEEDDLYLSGISPLGVPFNSVRGSSKDIEKLENALNGRPGSPCPKKFLKLYSENGERPICTASRTYQSKKIDELNSSEIEQSEYTNEYEKITEKACLCIGLATSALKKNNAADKVDGEGVLVCPGPNMAYFSSVATLNEMINHIYGKSNLLNGKKRPNMFIKELNLYIDYFKEEIAGLKGVLPDKKVKYIKTFYENISNGIEFYRSLFSSIQNKYLVINDSGFDELNLLERKFEMIIDQNFLTGLFSNKLTAV